MPVHHDLDQRWRLLVPAGAVVVDAASRRVAVRAMRALPPQTLVVLIGGRRLRLLAHRARLHLEAEYVALPSLATPVAITQVDRGPLRWTARTVLTVPSGVTRLHAPIWLAVRGVRAFPRLIAWAPAGDRMAVGTKL